MLEIESSWTTEFVAGLTPANASYLAGLIDGDGHIGLHRRRTDRTRSGYNYQAHVEIASVDEQFLREVQQLIGGGCWKRKQQGFKSHKPCYHLTITPNTLRRVLPIITPHLRLKRERALALLEALDLVQKGRHGQSPRLHEIYMRLKNLNRRGTIE